MSQANISPPREKRHSDIFRFKIDLQVLPYQYFEKYFRKITSSLKSVNQKKM